ncbi:hypothetical protein [Streptococcus suis]|uniref:hypothetical protein n=1 Tax=Streptococcus suis TaxID=1307 RepID=UPI000CF50BA8|nr:hypothetical protein [Streptococcus suis]
MAVTMQEQQTQSDGYVVYVRDTVGLQARYKVVHEGLDKYVLKLYDSNAEECYFDDFNQAVRMAEILRVQEGTDYLILPIPRIYEDSLESAFSKARNAGFELGLGLTRLV